MTHCVVCSADTDLFLCKSCGSELERAIGDVTSLLHELSLSATRQTRVHRASGTAQRPQEQANDPEGHIAAWLRSKDGRTALRPTVMPVNLDASELMWVIGNTLSTWTRHLCENRGIETPTAAGMIGWLLAHIDSIRADEAAGEIHDEITSLHRDAERAVDRSPSRLFAGPCHAPILDEDDQPRGRCERDLYAWPNAVAIKCDGHRSDNLGCGAEHTQEDRRAWLQESVTDALQPLDVWRQGLPSLFDKLTFPNRSTWLRWTGQIGRKPGERPALQSIGQTLVGEPLYRGEDVLSLVRRTQARSLGNSAKTRRSA